MKLTYLRNDLLMKAIAIAVEAHRGHKRKDGSDYITHPIRVMDRVQTDDEKIVAILHDVVEDTDVTLDDLFNQGFEQKHLDALDAVTKRSGEQYLDEFIPRVKAAGVLAISVKLADIDHNLEDQKALSRDEADFLRRRYEAAREILQENR